MIPLLCTVRGCALPLERIDRTLRCANNHSFDLARSGYANLLQPQDRRSANPGDRKEAVLARRRLLDDGYAAPLTERLISFARSIHANTILDAGCGEGTHLGRLAAELDAECSGVDISVHAIDLAAKRYPAISWVVANADRWLPYPGGTFDLIMSITARRNAPEFARVLRESGQVVVAVPAVDDLAELRTAAQGSVSERSRVESVAGELASHFELASQEVVRDQRELERDALLALLHATYRGLRHSARQRVEALERMRVTFAWDVMTFRRRGA